MASSNQKHEDAVELFLSANPQKLAYKGPCNVDIKVLSKILVVEPYDNDTCSIELSVYSMFVKHNNILCHFSLSNTIAMVFPTVDACKTVYDLLMTYQGEVKQEVDGHSSNQQIRNLFFIPLLKEAKSNPAFNERAKDCVINLMEDIATLVGAKEVLEDDIVKSELDEGLHQMLTESCKESSDEPMVADTVDDTYLLDDYQHDDIEEEPRVSCITETNGVVSTDSSERLESPQNDSRKRHTSAESNVIANKQCKTEVVTEQEAESTVPPGPSALIMQTKKIVKSTHFLIHRLINAYASTRHELIVFVSDEKNLCYPYCFERKKTGNRFSCINCQKMKHSAIAHLRCDEESGEYFVEFGLIRHACAPAVYARRVNEVIEPCTSYSSLFFGIPSIKKRKRGIAAPVKADNSAPNITIEALLTQVLTSGNSEKPVLSPPDSINEVADPLTAIQSPDFELRIITENGIQENELITFASSDHQFCYTFQLEDEASNLYVCKKCRIRRHKYSVFLRVGEDGQKFVEFSRKFGHICSPESYPPTFQEADLLEKDEYEITYTREGNIRPIIYASKEKNLIYSFSFKYKNTYVCDGCEGNSIYAALNLKENFGFGFTVAWISHKTLHSCEPKEYVNEIEEKVLMAGRFKFFIEKETPNEVKLFTFPFDDENDKCHIYKYSIVLQVFCCIKCLEFDHVAVAQVFYNSNMDEYILEGNLEKHICEPVDYSSLDSTKFTIEPSSGIIVKKFYEKQWIEKNQIQAKNFEFHRGRHGALNGVLIIFPTEERDVCYKYHWNVKKSSQYICNGCKVSAKTFKDENGKYFCRPSITKHRCDGPVPYTPDRKTIRKPDFILHSLKPFQLIVFTSPSHNFCHVYVYATHQHLCRKCHGIDRNKKNVHATMFTDENGEECVLLSRTPHRCQPEKFSVVAKKFNIKK